MNSAVVLSGGSSTRFDGHVSKVLHRIDGKICAEKAALAFSCLDYIDEVIVVIPAVDSGKFDFLKDTAKTKIVYGGKTRFESALLGLKAVSTDCNYVAIHDGARPYVTSEIIDRSFECAREKGNGIAAVRVSDTLRMEGGGILGEVLPRESILAIQTPQTFDFSKIMSAYENAFAEYGDKAPFTDDSSVFSRYVGDCFFSLGDKGNVKLTYKEDVKESYRAGVGYDIHTLEKGRELFLCGVKIDFHKGLKGHSDADAPIHAIMDAMLSAVGEKDIGHHFPDTDIKFKDIDSKILLKKVVGILAEKSATVVNVSVSIVCEKPRLSGYIDEMKSVLAEVLDISSDKVGISVTTNEGVPMTKGAEAIAAFASVLVSTV